MTDKKVFTNQKDLNDSIKNKKKKIKPGESVVLDEREKIWTQEELNEVRLNVKAECWKKRGDGICDLGEVEMYDHEGGVFVKEVSKKQWVYFTCRTCKYQWALWKLLRRLKEGPRI